MPDIADKPIVSSPITEKDIVRNWKEDLTAIVVIFLVIGLIVLGTWVYLTHIKN
jgi:hypothetical protein